MTISIPQTLCLSLLITLAFLGGCNQQKEPEVKPSSPAADSSASSSELGRKVYEGTCKTCHDSGLAGAPKLGDKQAWSSHLAKGREHLVQSALNGTGKMPPKGGNASLSKEEIRAAVDYMVGQVQ